jgi:hypothetical protein
MEFIPLQSPILPESCVWPSVIGNELTSHETACLQQCYYLNQRLGRYALAIEEDHDHSYLLVSHNFVPGTYIIHLFVINDDEDGNPCFPRGMCVL